MSSRQEFLDRVRRASAAAIPAPRHPVTELGGEPPRVESRGEDGLDAFVAALTGLGGHVRTCGEIGEARRNVLEIVASRAPVLLSSEADVSELGLEGLRWPECGVQGAAAAAVAVVGSVAAVAATGSLVVDASSARGRSLSLLPPVVIVLARGSRLVATPGDVLRNRDRLWPDGVPSQVLLITGPSRSADIEMTLTRGVHGPGELHALLLLDR